ncbi:MAG TPA: hypothetical protein VMU93_03925 [Caulobacteraceae bacterium]|nr:hypothetical protein [Caulobacteraceae bacterium]
MKTITLVAVSALTLALCGSAAAAVTVVGDTSANDCSKAAFAGLANNETLETCNSALQMGELDRRDEAGTYVNRGVLYMLLQNYGAARSDFEEATHVEPKLGESWVNLGAVEIGEKRYQAGVTDIDKALALGIEEPAKAYYNRAIAYEGMDDEKSAYLDYQQAVTLAPNWNLPKQELLRFTVTRR